ncbi:MAG: pyridoxal-dependent decarboxylase [Terriglobales bacterium]
MPLASGMQGALSHVVAAAENALDTTSSGYMAYIPGGGLFATAIADLVSDVLNRYTGLAEAAPELWRLERDVLRWLSTSFGYDEDAEGLFTSGGSLATFAAVAAARDAAVLAGGDDLRRLAGYTSAEAHASVSGAFRLAGLPVGNLRHVSTDSCFRLRSDHLKELVATDRANNLVPFIIIATAGTTNTGAIDPLGEIARISRDEKLWMHTDAAYGGAFVLCPEGRQRLAGIEQSHSITLDPHKGLFLPYGTGCLLFRSAALLPQTRSEHAPYLHDLQATAGNPGRRPADFQLELTRPFRGLRLWLPLVVHGAGAFRDALEEKLALAKMLSQRLEGLAAEGYPIEIVTTPQLSIVPFRLCRRPGELIESWNARNRDFLRLINGSGRTILSSTLLPSPAGDVFTLRACILSHRTHAKDVENCFEDIRPAADSRGERRSESRP